MTSSKNDGSRARGISGGLIINGNAPINACADSEGEACEAYGEGGTGWYGGNDLRTTLACSTMSSSSSRAHSSAQTTSFNGIAFQGVGAGTEVDFIQVHMNADDGVEFYGGTVSAKHVLVTGAGDDSVDWTDGWQGNAQFVVVQQYDDNGDNGIEADNNEANDADPMSEPTLANVTLIGSPDSEDSDIGMLLREGTGAHIVNSMILGFNDACLDIDHDATWSNIDSGDVTLEGGGLKPARPASRMTMSRRMMSRHSSSQVQATARQLQVWSMASTLRPPTTARTPTSLTPSRAPTSPAGSTPLTTSVPLAQTATGLLAGPPRHELRQ